MNRRLGRLVYNSQIEQQSCNSSFSLSTLPSDLLVKGRLRSSIGSSGEKDFTFPNEDPISRNKTIFASAGNAETWSRVSDVVRGCARPGFKYPNTKSGRKWWTYAESFCLLAWNLAQHATHFKHLTFVHLEEFQVLSYLGNVENRKIWSAIEDLVVARPKMDVTVVHLEHPDSFKEMDESSVVMLQCLEAIVPLTHRVAYFDIKGRWELEPKYADEDGDK